MSNKLSFKLSDLKALLAVFENIAGRSLSTGEFIGLLDLMNSFESKEKGGDNEMNNLGQFLDELEMIIHDI